jgi:hypothetical protein
MFYAVVHLLQTSSLSSVDKMIIMLYLILCLASVLIAFIGLVFAGAKIRRYKRLTAKNGVKD